MATQYFAYVRDFKGNDPRFSAYVLESALARKSSDKAAVPGVNRNDLHALDVRVTRDVGQQRAVVSILNVYDDLIENNRRRIHLLEQEARLIYREWFVRLRFPGCEHFAVTEGVPKGWRRDALSAICRDVRNPVDPNGLPPSTAYIGLEHLPRRSITLGDWASSTEVESTKLMFHKGDILFGKIRPYFHKVGFALTDGIASSDVIIICPKKRCYYEFVLLLLSSDEFVSLASRTVREGSKMPRADWKFLLTWKIPVPGIQLLNSFGDVIRPILDQLRKLAWSIRRLAEGRDLLLPRLMDGEIVV